MQLRNLGVGGENKTDSIDNVEHTTSRMSGYFLTESARQEMLDWMVRALSTKKSQQKLGGDHGAVLLEHAWIFQFIDIIYVGTIFKLSHMIGHCGRGIDVYMLCFSYFAIMFSTRLSFDVYTCISGASGVLHLIAFCMYGMGTFVMTVNISSQTKHDSSSTTDDGSHAIHMINSYSSNEKVTYGNCERSIDYDTAFAVAFIFTRFILIIMYGLYFFVFHESNIIGQAPADMNNLGKNIRLSDLTRESDLESALRESELRRTTSKLPNQSIDSYHNNSNNNSHNITHSNDNSTDNPMLTRLTMHRTSFVIKIANNFRDSMIKKHFLRIFLLKVIPVIISCIVMSAMLFGASPVIILPIVAFIEFIGDFLPSGLINDSSDWKELNPHRHFSQERLGLFFMLVLGEAVLGFSVVSYESDSMSKIYRLLL